MRNHSLCSSISVYEILALYSWTILWYDIGTIVVEHKDRATRFGFRYLETLLIKAQGRTIEVVNQADNSTEDLTADLTAIISSLCTSLYGQRRAQGILAKIVQELKAENATG